jgi:hypothetical protein
MILGRMIDVVVWEAVIGGPGLCVPWQLCFLPGNIGAGTCFGTSKATTYNASKFHFLL